MKEFTILTPACEEQTVYLVEEDSLRLVYSQLFMQLSGCIEVQSPEHYRLYKAINSPIKILKNKNNKDLNTSVKVSFNNTIFECLMKKPEDLHKSRSWHCMCEDFMQINITFDSNSPSESSRKINFKLYAVKIANDSEEVLSHFQFFIDQHTLDHLDLCQNYISDFLQQNGLRKSYLSIYNSILQRKPFEEFLQNLESSVIKNNMECNEKFFFICLYIYNNPGDLLKNMLCNNIIDCKWKNGKDFLEYFSTFFDQFPLNIVDPIINHYDLFLLNHKLKSCLPCKQPPKKTQKI